MTPAPVFGDDKRRWSMGSIVRGSWWEFTGEGADEFSVVGTVARLHSVDGNWVATLHYDGEDVAAPTEFPVEQITAVEPACGS